MRLTKKQAAVVERLIGEWRSRGMLSAELAQRLRATYEVVTFDWRRLARYSFWIATACAAIAVGALVRDELLEPALVALFGNVARGYCAVFAAAALGLFTVGVARKRRAPSKRLGTEGIFFLGVLALAASVGFLGAELGLDHASSLFLLAAALYAALGLWIPSPLVWVFALLAFGGWFGAETGYASGWGMYYLGMGYPLRFVIFGAALVAGSFAFTAFGRRREFMATTRVVGMLYLFTALWILSIFGNYGELADWRASEQWKLAHWSIAFAAAAVAAIYLGIRYDDKAARGFGLTFLFINLYTRYFEYFWDHLPKAVFFSVLAVSFWLIGSRAERIWRMASPKTPPSGLDD